MVRAMLRVITWPLKAAFRLLWLLAIIAAMMVGSLYVMLPGGTVSEKAASAKALRDDVAGEWQNVVTVVRAIRNMAGDTGNTSRGSAPAASLARQSAQPVSNRTTHKDGGMKPSPDAAAATPIHGRLSPAEAELVRLLNMERAKRGLRPLAVDMRLVASARRKAQDMAVNNYFSHDSPSGETVSDLIRMEGLTGISVGENLACGLQVLNLHQFWMNSAGHRRNMLNPNWTHVGIGTIPNNRPYIGNLPCGLLGSSTKEPAVLGIIGVQHFAKEAEQAAPGSSSSIPTGAGSTGTPQEALAEENPSTTCLDALSQIPPEQRATDGKPGWRCDGDKLVFD